MNNVPPFSQNRGDIKYIKFEILQIVSPSEDVKFSNVRGLYLRKYGSYFLGKKLHPVDSALPNFTTAFMLTAVNCTANRPKEAQDKCVHKQMHGSH